MVLLNFLNILTFNNRVLLMAPLITMLPAYILYASAEYDTQYL